MFIVALALTFASTWAFTVTAPAKVASATALSSYYSPYRIGYGYSTRPSYRYGYTNRYDDDMYGEYYYNRRGTNSYRYDDFDRATITREPFYYDGRDNNFRSSYSRSYGNSYGRDRGSTFQLRKLLHVVKEVTFTI